MFLLNWMWKKQKSNLDENSNSKTIKSEDNSKLGEKNAKEIVHEYLGDGKFHFNAGPLYDNEYVEKLIFDVYYDNTDSRFNITLNGDLDYNIDSENKDDFSKNSYYEDSENKIHRFYIENNEDKNMNGIYEFKTEGSAEIKDIKLVLVKTNLNQDDYLYNDHDNSKFESNNKREYGSDEYENYFMGIDSFKEYGDKFKEVTNSVIENISKDSGNLVG